MRHTAYFLIEPKDVTDQRFVGMPDDFATVLREPVVVSRDFADRSGWGELELTLAVKLLYVARLREYRPLTSDADAERVLGSAAVSAETFDRWWSIRRIEFEASEEVMQECLADAIAKVPPTGNAMVDRWLEGLKSR